jgi:hypothetical protein
VSSNLYSRDPPVAGTPTASEMARAEIVICALAGLREQLAVGIAADLATIRASLLELLA